MISDINLEVGAFKRKTLAGGFWGAIKISHSLENAVRSDYVVMNVWDGNLLCTTGLPTY